MLLKSWLTFKVIFLKVNCNCLWRALEYHYKVKLLLPIFLFCVNLPPHLMGKLLADWCWQCIKPPLQSLLLWLPYSPCPAPERLLVLAHPYSPPFLHLTTGEQHVSRVKLTCCKGIYETLSKPYVLSLPWHIAILMSSSTGWGRVKVLGTIHQISWSFSSQSWFNLKTKTGGYI